MARQSSVATVPNDPIRDAVEKSGIKISDLCMAIDFVSKGQANVSGLKRSLGLVAWRNKHADGTRSTWFSKEIELDRAQKIAEVIGVDFDSLYPSIPSSVSTCFCGRCGEGMVERDNRGLCGFCIEEQSKILA